MLGYAAAHAVIIDWYGPFSSPDAAIAWVSAHPERVPGTNSVPMQRQEGEHRKPSGIYLAIGTLSLAKVEQRWKHLIQQSRLQYVGIGNVVARLRKKKHPIRAFLGRCDQIWVGALGSYPSPADAPAIGQKIHDNQLELAEALLAYFLEAPLNQRKREHVCPPPGILFNRWFRVDRQRIEPFAGSPHHSVPDIVVWPYDGPADTAIALAKARQVRMSPLLPEWLTISLAKAALVRFNARVGDRGVRTTTIISDAMKARQFDKSLLRKPKRSRLSSIG